MEAISRHLSALTAISWTERVHHAGSSMKTITGSFLRPSTLLCPMRPGFFLKRHLGNLADMRDEEQKSLASILENALGSIHSTLDDPPYNLMIFQLPNGYHFNIRIQPAVSKIAGFERSTGIYINPVPPE